MSLLHERSIKPKTATSSAPAADGFGVGMEESRLWDAFRTGNEEAFITIYKQYANVLFNFGCQLTMDHDLVKDTLQDFFIYLRHKRNGLGKTDAIKP